MRLRLKSLVLLAIVGTSVLAIAIVSTLGSETEVFGPRLDTTLQWGVRLVTVLLTGLLLTVVFRLAAARRHHVGRAAPGAFTVAVLWQGLQYVGTQYTTRVLAETKGMNFVFALVLGLIGIIYVAALVGVFGMEVNVVLARRLWPRSIRTLFVDRGELTDADRRAYASYVRAQQHKQAENVDVSFKDPETGELQAVEEPGPRGKMQRLGGLARTMRLIARILPRSLSTVASSRAEPVAQVAEPVAVRRGPRRRSRPGGRPRRRPSPARRRRPCPRRGVRGPGRGTSRGSPRRSCW